MGLQQHVNFSTHTGGHCLDLVITEVVHGISVVKCEQGPYISDHCVVKSVISVEKDNIVSKHVTYRNWKNVCSNEFSSDLLNIPFDSVDIDTLVCTFETELQNIVDKHAPVKEKTLVVRKQKAWFNDNIMKLKRTLRKAERIWRKYRQQDQFEYFKQIRSLYSYEICKQKKTVMVDKIENAKGNTKHLYRIVSELTGTKSENPMPSAVNDTTLAEQFADFFMDKIATIRNALNDYQCFEPIPKDTLCFNSFQELSQTDVKRIISELNTKSCSIDILPTHILKSFLNELLPCITRIVNLSLADGVFPSNWKQAIVRPLLKKAGLELHLSNYRPVSNLSFLSKVIEKAALHPV
ncbi:uncharacterized protein LOC128223518 [Mya arenaria]|uniref:uncharacterized protein LOC128223518 n=1 Tax=Mya arenaria TaxID=6604 RepID=UPI0022E7ED63|nr:uncharacterized protein LOC128223518 [Mya arenaria]